MKQNKTLISVITQELGELRQLFQGRHQHGFIFFFFFWLLGLGSSEGDLLSSALRDKKALHPGYKDFPIEFLKYAGCPMSDVRCPMWNTADSQS